MIPITKKYPFIHLYYLFHFEGRKGLYVYLYICSIIFRFRVNIVNEVFKILVAPKIQLSKKNIYILYPYFTYQSVWLGCLLNKCAVHCLCSAEGQRVHRRPLPAYNTPG